MNWHSISQFQTPRMQNPPLTNYIHIRYTLLTAQLHFALSPESSQSTFSVHWHTVTDITTSYHKDSLGEYVIEQKIKTNILFSNA